MTPRCFSMVLDIGFAISRRSKKENILGRAKRHSRYRTVLHVYKENIPHV